MDQLVAFLQTHAEELKIHGSLVFGIVASSLDYLSQGRTLINPFRREPVNKMTRSLCLKLWCLLLGAVLAYGLSVILYAPAAAIRAVFVALLVVPAVHEGRIANLVRAVNPKR